MGITTPTADIPGRKDSSPRRLAASSLSETHSGGVFIGITLSVSYGPWVGILHIFIYGAYVPTHELNDILGRVLDGNIDGVPLAQSRSTGAQQGSGDIAPIRRETRK